MRDYCIYSNARWSTGWGGSGEGSLTLDLSMPWGNSASASALDRLELKLSCSLTPIGVTHLAVEGAHGWGEHGEDGWGGTCSLSPTLCPPFLFQSPYLLPLLPDPTPSSSPLLPFFLLWLQSFQPWSSLTKSCHLISLAGLGLGHCCCWLLQRSTAAVEGKGRLDMGCRAGHGLQGGAGPGKEEQVDVGQLAGMDMGGAKGRVWSLHSPPLLFSSQQWGGEGSGGNE